MRIRSQDRHWQFDPVGERLKCYAADGALEFTCACRNRTVASGFGHDGQIPPAEYVLGKPVREAKVKFGPWFVPIADASPGGALEQRGRSGLGVHGGGTGLPDPFAAQQGWQVTDGCLRVQNQDLEKLVVIVAAVRDKGGINYLTVGAPLRGLVGGELDVEE